jgi:hypothetical protein
LILAVVAAVGGGVALAASRKSDSSPGVTPTAPPRTTISAGATVVGRP